MFLIVYKNESFITSNRKIFVWKIAINPCELFLQDSFGEIMHSLMCLWNDSQRVVFFTIIIHTHACTHDKESCKNEYIQSYLLRVQQSLQVLRLLWLLQVLQVLLVLWDSMSYLSLDIQRTFNLIIFQAGRKKWNGRWKKMTVLANLTFPTWLNERFLLQFTEESLECLLFM